ncbi:MAG TPA: molybdenum cofactor biosynthesis protein MoaE [Chthoniobacterales bacterium]|nr:molybdenum cofactor biosynthesis protein MoaE [Chthoniobacterales bacterium]
MANIVCDVLLTDAPLILPAEVPPAETGAIVDFLGVVRATEETAQIAGLRYEAHREMAEYQLRMVADECLQQFEVKQLLVHHRIGFVAVGEASLLVRVGSEHRAEAFRASAWIVDELKRRVPIWKHPVRTPAAAAVSFSA